MDSRELEQSMASPEYGLDSCCLTASNMASLLSMHHFHQFCGALWQATSKQWKQTSDPAYRAGASSLQWCRITSCAVPSSRIIDDDKSHSKTTHVSIFLWYHHFNELYTKLHIKMRSGNRASFGTGSKVGYGNSQAPPTIKMLEAVLWSLDSTD